MSYLNPKQPSNSTIKFPTKITPELAEETGWHVGDGSMNIYKNRGLYQLRGHIIDDKKHYLERIKPIFERLYDTNIHLREMSKTGVFGFQIWNTKLIEFKNKKLNLPLGKKTDYEVPLEILDNDKLKIAFLRGIFDTDGCIYIENKRGKPYPRVEIRISCNKLSEKLKEMCSDLGMRTTRYSQNRDKDNWSTIYCISIRGREMANKWIDIISPKNSKHTAKWKEYLSSTRDNKLFLY